ncbi:uncharacterized protein BO72DRAFT_282028 [Aspergillus fijiensis CBS 313.89]|uniref:Uncharacterized protein n=1 Tax=Aspergillus fijiensis CBS 313.89 TaxID=1448319 RepID=A0A8G1W2C2_9EURO|nr:uncharacterized protein BO72DRAFT_282028 [Aspergillus fijiensis CBS 313.89]RAK80523.1 hypothetical protein BO72DRAFT_282028 [Aspergillus fijiensis CBS 313.89]
MSEFLLLWLMDQTMGWARGELRGWFGSNWLYQPLNPRCLQDIRSDHPLRLGTQTIHRQYGYAHIHIYNYGHDNDHDHDHVADHHRRHGQ